MGDESWDGRTESLGTTDNFLLVTPLSTGQKSFPEFFQFLREQQYTLIIVIHSLNISEMSLMR